MVLERNIVSLKVHFLNVRGQPHIDFHTECVTMTQITYPLYFPVLRHSQVVDKTDSFPKDILTIFNSKKGR